MNEQITNKSNEILTNLYDQYVKLFTMFKNEFGDNWIEEYENYMGDVDSETAIGSVINDAYNTVV